MHLSSKTFTRAAQIAEQLESLENQPSVLLQGGDSIGEKQNTPKAAPKRSISSPKKAASAAPRLPKKEEERYDQLWSRS